MQVNEGGVYYNLPEEHSWSTLSHFTVSEKKSYNLLVGRHPTEENEIHILEVNGIESAPRILQVYKIPFCISDAKAFPVSHKLFLFVVGHESSDKVGRESVFFFSEISLTVMGHQLKTNLKHKKLNLFALDNLEDKVYLMSDWAIYRYSLSSFSFELFYEMLEKKWNYRFRHIRVDKTNRKIIATAESDLMIFDANNNSKLVLGGARVNDRKVPRQQHLVSGHEPVQEVPGGDHGGRSLHQVLGHSQFSQPQLHIPGPAVADHVVRLQPEL